MKNYHILFALLLLLTFGCGKRTTIVPEEISEQEDLRPSSDKKGITYCGKPIKNFLIKYTNQVGYGFSFQDYFVQDWTGDGILDVMGRKPDGRMFFYRGYAHNNGISSTPGNVTNDLGVGQWSYKLANGVQVGNGWNFSEYHPGDWNGDGKCDMMAFLPNGNGTGTMYLYIWNGTNFLSPTTHSPGAGQIWNQNRKRMVVDINGDGRSDLIEVFTIGQSGYLRRLSWNGTFFNPYGQYPGFDFGDEYLPFDMSQENITDLVIRKADGTLHYRKGLGAAGGGSGYSAPKQIGNGWNTFQDLYPGYNWSLCAKISSITGRKSNGDFYTYIWNLNSESLQPGRKVGTGWGFDHIFVGDLIPDIWNRHDYLGINPNGTMHAYETILEVQ